MRKQKQAFTLVELIVVITILAILGTIAFISLQGYSKDARDSIRISDTSNMKTSLELFHLNSGKYPLPDDYGTFTYSGNTLFYQGYFGDSVVQSVSRSITEVPTDPLTDKKYIYSVSNTKNEIELLSLLEGDGISLNKVIQTNAAVTTVVPKITGNYNGLFLKTTTHIVPLPSIINTEVYENTVTEITQSKIESMVTNLGANIPNNGSVVSNTGALTGLVLTGALNNLTKDSTDTDKAAVIEIIKSAYVGETSLSTNGIINYILNIGTDETILAGVFDTTVLNRVSTVVTTSGGGEETGLDISVCSAASSGDIIYESTLTSDSTGLTCDHNIAVCNGTGTGYIIAACNIGTNTVATANNDSSAYGELFQWGNNAGLRFQYNEPLTSPIQILITATGSTYSSGTFIYDTSDWNTTQNDNLWGNGTNTDEARIGPCLTGYHVPTQPEWAGIHTAGGWNTTTDGLNMSNALKMPMAGYRNWSDAALLLQGAYGYYWSSSTNGTYGYRMRFDSNGINPIFSLDRAYGFSVRCFKN